MESQWFAWWPHWFVYSVDIDLHCMLVENWMKHIESRMWNLIGNHWGRLLGDSRIILGFTLILLRHLVYGCWNYWLVPPSPLFGWKSTMIKENFRTLFNNSTFKSRLFKIYFFLIMSSWFHNKFFLFHPPSS